jgi:uncharacterized membrane protein YeiH
MKASNKWLISISPLRYTTLVLLTVLDFIGTFAFAVFGAHKAIQKQFDLFGIFICAISTALGGGMIREMMLGNSPVFLHNYTYVYIVLLGVVFALAIRRMFRKFEPIMLVIDAVGLSVFAFIGAQRADASGLGVGAMVCFAVLTAAGGGVISDLLTQRKPSIFYRDFYATPAMLGGVGYWVLRPQIHDPMAIILLLIGICSLRLVKVYLMLTKHKHYRKIVNVKLRWQES